MKIYKESMVDYVELPPDPERVMEGLRDTGYTFNTAMADIIDNSISAHATKIDIQVISDPNSNITVYVADNGIGMDQEALENAMRYGQIQTLQYMLRTMASAWIRKHSKMQ